MILHPKTQSVRSGPAWARFVVAFGVCALVLQLAGCAVLAGGAAGAATGYVAGKAARD